MPSELDRKTEKLLHAYAAKRREQSGPPLELHLADRRLLQSEVRRAYGVSGRSPRWWPAVSPRFWPRLGLAVSIFLVLGVGLWALMQPPQKGTDVAALDTKPNAELRVAKGIPPAVAEPTPSPTISQSAPTDPADKLARQLKPAAAASAPAAPAPARDKVVAQDSPSSGTTESLRLRAEAQPAPGKPTAPQPDTRLSFAAKGAAQPAETVMSRAQPMPQVQAPPPGTSGWLAGDPAATASFAATQTYGAIAAPAGTAALAEKSSAPLLAARAPALPQAPAVTSTESSSEQGSLGRELYRLGLSLATNEQATTKLASARQVEGTQQFGYDSSLSLVQEKLKSQSTGAANVPEARPALMASAPSRARSVTGFAAGKASAEVAAASQLRDSTMKKDWLARADTANRIDFEDRDAPPGRLLSTFEFEQDGNRVRIRELDGSIYEGQLQEADSDATFRGGRAVESEQRSTAKKETTPAQPGIKFRLSGTSRRLEQFVVIDAFLVGSLLPRGVALAAGAPTNGGILRDRPDTKAPIVTSAPRLLLEPVAPAEVTTQVTSQSEAQAGAKPNVRADTDAIALRLQGRALVGGTNEIRIDAIRRQR